MRDDVARELLARVAELTRERDALLRNVREPGEALDAARVAILHLRGTDGEERQRTPRGFDVYDEIETDYGHTIRVQQSSSAEKSAVWLFISDSPVTCRHNPHLTRDQARRVRDALSTFLTDTEGSDDE